MYYQLVAQNLIEEIGQSTWTLELPATIGRSPEHLVAINHESVSRTHCRLALNADGALTVRDMNSMNGIYLGDEKTSRAILKPGDILRVGAISFRVDFVPEPRVDVPVKDTKAYDLSTTVPMKVPRFRNDEPVTSAAPQPEKKWWQFWS